MGLFASLRRVLGGGRKNIKQAAMTVVQLIGTGAAKWMDRDMRVFADEGFRRNNIVFRCVQIISENLASVDLHVYRGDERVDDHPLKRLLDRPNPRTGGSNFWEAVCAYQRITGNSYIEVIRNGQGVPAELWAWQPYQVKVVPDGNSPMPRAWVWDDGQHKRLWEVDRITGSADIMQWKTFHPFDPWFGMSPLEAAAYSVDQHNSAGEWNQALLQNSGAPSGMLTTPGTLDDPQYEKLKREIEETFTGPGNAGRPFLGERGLQWQAIAMSPKEIDWLGGRKANAGDICAVYGVPTQMLGIEGSQTFANYEQARLSVWEDTVLPLLDELVDELNNWLTPMYGDRGLLIGYERSEIPALESKKVEAMKSIDGLSYLTPNEKRAAAGYEARPERDADQLWIGGGMVPMGEDEDAGAEDGDPEALADARRMLGMDIDDQTDDEDGEP